MPIISTKPYLLRAIYEWCTDSGYTPYITVQVDNRTRVPSAYVKNGEIVLNVGYTATSGLKIDNDFIRFNARFAGVTHDVIVPVANVTAIYARENGQGMAFEVESPAAEEDSSETSRERQETSVPAPVLTEVPPSAPGSDTSSAGGNEDNTDPPKKGGRPTLRRIK